MARTLRSLLPLVAWISFAVVMVGLVSFISPETLIERIGVESAYTLLFVLALLGGFSVFSGVPYYIVLVTLATSGLNPYVLGSIAALAVMLGDSTSYMLGYLGRSVVPEQMQPMLARITAFEERHPRMLPAFFFCYGLCAPFSNDLITIPMGISHYPFWKVFIPLAVGNTIFNISLALLSVHAYSFVQSVFL